jgi:hypothetical protein
MNYLKRASDKQVSPESLGVGYGWVGVILEVSPCQCRQYNNAEATWAYVGCRLVALRQLESTEKANGCAEHGQSNQPGPAPKGGYSLRPAVCPNFATTGPDAHPSTCCRAVHNVHVFTLKLHFLCCRLLIALDGAAGF